MNGKIYMKSFAYTILDDDDDDYYVLCVSVHRKVTLLYSMVLNASA